MFQFVNGENLNFLDGCLLSINWILLCNPLQVFRSPEKMKCIFWLDAFIKLPLMNSTSRKRLKWGPRSKFFITQSNIQVQIYSAEKTQKVPVSVEKRFSLNGIKKPNFRNFLRKSLVELEKEIQAIKTLFSSRKHLWKWEGYSLTKWNFFRRKVA